MGAGCTSVSAQRRVEPLVNHDFTVRMPNNLLNLPLILLIPPHSQFKTNAEILLHCDVADVVGLLCLRPAARNGTGLSRLVSSVSVYNTLLRERPEVAAVLRQRRFVFDTRGSGGVNFVRLPIVAYSAGGQLSTFWHSEYYRTWTQYPDAPAGSSGSGGAWHDGTGAGAGGTGVSPGARDTDAGAGGTASPAVWDVDAAAALDAWDEVSSRPGYSLEMALQRGDMQLVNNHVVVHARTAYSDEGAEHRRTLLRLWISLDSNDDDSGSGSTALLFRDQLSKWWSAVQLGGSFVVGKVRRWWFAQR